MSLFDDVNRSFGNYGSTDPFQINTSMPGDAPVHESWMDVPVFSRMETMPKFSAEEEERPQAGWKEAIFSPIAEEPASWKQTIGGIAQLPVIRWIPGVEKWGKSLGEEGMKEQERIQPRFEDASPEYYTYLTGKTLVPMLEDMAMLSAAGAATGALAGPFAPVASPALAAVGAGAGVLKNLYRFMKLRMAMNAARTGAQEYNKLKQQGYSDWAAIPLSIGYGGLEWIGDKIGLKALETPNLSVLKRLVLSAASEVPGETTTTIGQAFLDKISTDPDMTMDDFLKQVRDTAVVAGTVGAGGGALAIPASRRFQKMEREAAAREKVPEEALGGLKETINNMVKDIGRVMPTIEQEYGPERAAALKRYLLFGIPMPPELEIAPTERIARRLRDDQLNKKFGFGVQAGEEAIAGTEPAAPQEPVGPGGILAGGGIVPGAGMQAASYVDLLSKPKAGTHAAVIEDIARRDEEARIRAREQQRQANLIGSGAAMVTPGEASETSLVGSPIPGRQTIMPGTPAPPITGPTSQIMFGVPSTTIAAAEQGAEGGEGGVGTGPTSEAYARWKQQAIQAFIDALRTGRDPVIPPLPGGVVTPQALGEAAEEARKKTGERKTPISSMRISPFIPSGPLGPAPESTTARAQTGLRLGQRKGILTPQVQPNPPGLPMVPSSPAAGAPLAPPVTRGKPIPPITTPLPGSEIQTPAAPTGTVGTSAIIATPNQKTRVAVRYRVVEADSVVASNDPVTFAPNPAYPPALQPRERAREGYQLQVENMVAALNPEMLAASPTTAQGAPVVGPDMVVESGNGRSMAIKRAYVSSPQQGAAYKQFLVNNAAAFGLDPNMVAGMKSPVLVRERTSEVPDRAAFAKEAGEADVSGMGAVEKARVDAQNMSQRLAELAVIDEDGNFDPLSKANTQFVAEWLQTVPASERGALFQNGMLTREGVARIKNALFAKAYPASDKLLTLVAESADPEIKNVANTLLGFAPAFARLRAMTEQGTRDSGLMVADEMARAAELYLDFKNQSNLDLQGFLLQQGLLAETQHADVTKAIAAVFNEHSRSQAKLRTFINHTIRLANESGQANLLGEMSPESKGDIVFLAYNLTEGGKKNDAIIRNILGLPAQEAGKDFGVSKGEPGIPGTSEGIQAPARERAEAGSAVAGPQVQEDIRTKSGEPFKSKSSATLAARKAGEGYVAVQVEGGWVARKTGTGRSMPTTEESREEGRKQRIAAAPISGSELQRDHAPEIARIAQSVYDSWDESNIDEYANGGICHLISEEVSGYLNSLGIEASTVSAAIGEQHVWTVARLSDGVYNVDIPPSVYEIGGGYSWKKIPDVKFNASDVVIERIDRNPKNFGQYVEDYEEEYEGEQSEKRPAVGPVSTEETVPTNETDRRINEIQKRLDALEQTTGRKPFAVGDKVVSRGRPATVTGYRGLATVNVRMDDGTEAGVPIRDVTKPGMQTAENVPVPEPEPETKIERTGGLNQGVLPGMSAGETFGLTPPEGEIGQPNVSKPEPEQTLLNFYDDAGLSTEDRRKRIDFLQGQLDLFGEEAAKDEQASDMLAKNITVPISKRTASNLPKQTDPELIGTAVRLEMKEKGFTTFVGKTIKFLSDIGYLGRLVRSFRFEYNHIIFYDSVTGETLLEQKITSFSNRKCNLVGSDDEMISLIRRAKQKTANPVTFAILHNHPGGDPIPSDTDIDTSRWASDIARRNGCFFDGHVIVNSDQYVVITDAQIGEFKDKVSGKKNYLERKQGLKSIQGGLSYYSPENIPAGGEDVFLSKREITQAYGEQIAESMMKGIPFVYEDGHINTGKTMQELAKWGMETQKEKNRGVVFFTNYQRKIVSLTDLPPGYLEDYERAKDFFVRASENTGASKIFLFIPEKLSDNAQNNLIRLMSNGYIGDASIPVESGGFSGFGEEMRKKNKISLAAFARAWNSPDVGGEDISSWVARTRRQIKFTAKGEEPQYPLVSNQGPGKELPVSPAGEHVVRDNNEVTKIVLEEQPALENPVIRDRVVGEVPLPERAASRYPYFGGGLIGKIIDTIRTYKHVDKGIQDRDIKALESLFMTPWALRKEHPEMKDALEIELQRHQDRKDINSQLVGDPDNWNPEKPVEHPIFGLSDDEVKVLQKIAQLSTVENVLYSDTQIKDMLARQGVTNPETVQRITRGYQAMKKSYDAAIKKQIEARENMLFFPYRDEPWAADLERIIRMPAEAAEGERIGKAEQMEALEEALPNYSKEEQARFRRAFSTLREPWNLVKKYRQSMGRLQFYTPLEHGEGDYILRITRPDEEGKPQVVWSYRTRTALEASKIWEELKRDPEMKDLHGLPGTITKEAGTPESAYYRVYDDNLYRFMLIGMERLRASKAYDEADIATFTKKMSQALADELKARAFGRRMMARRHSDIGGYERKDIRASFLDYMAGTAGIITKQEAAAKFYDLLRSIEKNKPATYDYVSRYVDDMLRNRDEIDRFFDKGKHMATLYYIAGNLRLPLVQITQNMIMSVPVMAREISKLDIPKTPEGLMKNLYKLGKHTGEAHRRVIKAMKDVTTGNMTEDEKAAVGTATRQGVTDAQFLKEIYGRMTNKWERGAVKTFDYAMQPFQLLERMNRQAAFLAMYRLQKEALMKQGVSEAEAKAEAVKKGNEFVYDTQVLYGKANMPEAMRGGTVGSKLLGMAYTFKQYPHHFIQYLAQGIKEGHRETIERMGKDADRLRFGPSMVYETPRYLYNYMKNALSAPGFEATILSMAWTVALGGAAAFPFLDDLLELYERATGNPIRAKMSRVVRAGIPTMFGMDIGSSLKISAPWTIGTNFMEGLSESALGVYGGIVEKFGKAMESAWSGNYYKAIESAAPTMIEYPMKAYREFTEGAKTVRGKTIFDSDGTPLRPTAGEAALQAVGIKGARMKEEGQIYRSFDMIEEYFNKWRNKIYQMHRNAKTAEDQAKVMSEITRFNLESKQKGMGGIAPITQESIRRASAERPSKRWLQFGKGINAE